MFRRVISWRMFKLIAIKFFPLLDGLKHSIIDNDLFFCWLLKHFVLAYQIYLYRIVLQIYTELCFRCSFTFAFSKLFQIMSLIIPTFTVAFRYPPVTVSIPRRRAHGTCMSVSGNRSACSSHLAVTTPEEGRQEARGFIPGSAFRKLKKKKRANFKWDEVAKKKLLGNYHFRSFLEAWKRDLEKIVSIFFLSLRVHCHRWSWSV